MKVLVTGATGFLGPYVIEALRAAGHEPIALARTRSDTRALEALKCRLREGDVTDEVSLREAFTGAEAVVHMAGLVTTKPDTGAELERVNVDGVRNVLAACRELGTRKLVHVSSVAAVGSSEEPNRVLDETSQRTLLGPRFPNFDTKARGEDLVLEAARAGQLDAVVLNPAMIYGAGDAVKAARRGNVLAARGKLAGYSRGGISVVSAESVAGALATALEKGRPGERYILSGDNLMLREILAIYADYAGVRPPRHEIPTWFLRAAGRAVDRFHLKGPLTYEAAVAATSFHWYSHAKAQRELGFRPGSARDAIRASVKWMAERGYL